MKWIALGYSIPSGQTSSPRVALWRRLKRLGAISPIGRFYLLPAAEDTLEAFRWLSQEIRAGGGEALLFEIDRFEEGVEEEIVSRFQAARDEEYREIGDEAKSVANEEPRDPGADEAAGAEQLRRLRKRLAEVEQIDYFHAAGAAPAAAALDEAEREVIGTGLEAEEAPIPTVDRAAYIGRTWVTRKRPHVDRLACAWLIRRFIDPQAEIRYDQEPEPGETVFDVPGAMFGHRGPLCTFETMIAAFGLDDDLGLAILAELVHEVDLRDGSSARPEIPGLDRILKGWLEAGFSDTELEAHGIALFEGLYAAFSRSSLKESR
ncbi:MAG TPA: chromate resistance protein ChrB domain-containing protein [Gemmatimonadota bacterium]|nr:chromate resistance protein ChrB domain-containing protein [Gemmatimonadota bacterium]